VNPHDHDLCELHEPDDGRDDQRRPQRRHQPPHQEALPLAPPGGSGDLPYGIPRPAAPGDLGEFRRQLVAAGER